VTAIGSNSKSLPQTLDSSLLVLLRNLQHWICKNNKVHSKWW